MQCTKCGAQLPDGSSYCNICGKKQQAVAAAEKKRKTKTRGNGTGTAVKRGKTWMARIVLGYYTGDDGKRHARTANRCGFATKKEALDYIPQLKKDAESSASLTLSGYWEFYEAKKLPELSRGKQTSYRIAWRRWEPLATRKIEDLKLETLQAAMDEAASSYYTAKDMQNLMSHFYKHAMANQSVNINLAKYLQLPAANPSEQIPFNSDEIAKMWNDFGAGNTFTGYILLMIYTGMMPGELLHARKAQIDWNGKQIRGAGLKTATRRETPIVLADDIIPVLRVLVDTSQGEKLVPHNKDNFYREYYSSLERIGARRLPPYSCRHTTGTDLAKAAVPAFTIQKIMRHAKITTTQIYTHMDATDALTGVNALKKPEIKGA